MIMSNLQKQIKIQSKLSSPFVLNKGVRHALVCLLFNITLEYAIGKSSIQRRSIIFYKLVQRMAYADDIVIIGRSWTSMREGFHLLEEASKEVGLVIYDCKTKYTVAVNTQNCSKPRAIEIGINFEWVDSFTYLGSLVTGNNKVSEEITNRHVAANR